MLVLCILVLYSYFGLFYSIISPIYFVLSLTLNIKVVNYDCDGNENDHQIRSHRTRINLIIDIVREDLMATSSITSIKRVVEKM